MSSQGELSVKLSVFIQNQLPFTKTYKKRINKGKNFFHRPGKIKKIKYILTPKGFKEKLLYSFLVFFIEKSIRNMRNKC